jgi:FixJ family two-component response regulator
MTTDPVRIYVVDDDSSARRALGRLLKSAGFPVKLFASAQELLDSGPVEAEAMIILDVRMPGINGLELQKRLTAGGKAWPIIFLTAFEDPRARSEALKHGAVAFLRKPVDEEVLFEAIRKAEASKGESSPSNPISGKVA